jgi:excisionase family DNA binding protein
MSEDENELLTPAEAMAILHCTDKTLSRWAEEGKIKAIRTPGGHRRYKAVSVRRYARRTGRDQL